MMSSSETSLWKTKENRIEKVNVALPEVSFNNDNNKWMPSLLHWYDNDSPF